VKIAKDKRSLTFKMIIVNEKFLGDAIMQKPAGGPAGF